MQSQNIHTSATSAEQTAEAEKQTEKVTTIPFKEHLKHLPDNSRDLAEWLFDIHKTETEFGLTEKMMIGSFSKDPLAYCSAIVEQVKLGTISETEAFYKFMWLHEFIAATTFHGHLDGARTMMALVGLSEIPPCMLGGLENHLGDILVSIISHHSTPEPGSGTNSEEEEETEPESDQEPSSEN